MATTAVKFEQELMDMLATSAKQRTSPGSRYYRLLNNQETLEGFKVGLVQYYFHTLGFTNALRYLYARCDEPALRSEVAEGLYEEETGGITGTAAHIELYYRLAESFDLPREKLVKHARLLPEMGGIIHWYHYAATKLSVLEGLACLNFAAEGQNLDFGEHKGSASATLHALKNHFKKTGDALTFSEVHSYADIDHCAVGARNIARLATTEELKDRVRTAMLMTFEFWKGNASVADHKLAECWGDTECSMFYL